MIYEKALEHAHYEYSKVENLGDGAWHRAWKVTGDKSDPVVLPVPKNRAYQKEVPYDEAALKAEYGGTEIYYRCVNEVVPGAAPEMFKNYVSEELTYTLESFAGNHVDLHQLTIKDAYQIGEDIGQLYRQLEQVDHGVKGFGFFEWNEEKGVHGQFTDDYHSFIEDECKEVMDDFEELALKRTIFNQRELKDALQRVCVARLKEIKYPVLTNQDASPENWLMDKGKIRIIDPLPIVYFGEVMAANFLNLYETLFVELAHTERYGKHRFHECQEVLQYIASGFINGYCLQNAHLIQILRGEQLLQILDSAVRHMRMIESGLSREQVIRYGSKEDVEKRLTAFFEKLIELQALINNV